MSFSKHLHEAALNILNENKTPADHVEVTYKIKLKKDTSGRGLTGSSVLKYDTSIDATIKKMGFKLTKSESGAGDTYNMYADDSGNRVTIQHSPKYKPPFTSVTLFKSVDVKTDDPINYHDDLLQQVGINRKDVITKKAKSSTGIQKLATSKTFKGPPESYKKKVIGAGFKEKSPGFFERGNDLIVIKYNKYREEEFTEIIVYTPSMKKYVGK